MSTKLCNLSMFSLHEQYLKVFFVARNHEFVNNPKDH